MLMNRIFVEEVLLLVKHTIVWLSCVEDNFYDLIV